MGLDYGSFFVAYELLAGGAALGAIASDLKAGKTIWQIGNERHARLEEDRRRCEETEFKNWDYIYRPLSEQRKIMKLICSETWWISTIRQDAVRTDFNVTPRRWPRLRRDTYSGARKQAR